ncbi:MAG TPA: BamA/TamA family outer membrane protein [Gemmatimonadaceae bacterium]|nr:BamA/TamA family outer membrane protein [Gemmatimonadaceae bacterium]
MNSLGILRRAGLQRSAALSLTLYAAAVDAQSSRPDSGRTGVRTVTVVAGAKYHAGWLHEFILGADYRALWTAPIEVEVLDLRTVAGGLRPTQRGGSAQTISLRFAGADGREYVFRPLEKDFTRGLPPELKETLVRDIAQDQVAGYHPGAPLVVSGLLDATGLHHPRPRLVVMPNDPALGEYRADFAGVLGTFEERPDSDFDETPISPGATNVISSERLFERMRSDHKTVVDARAFLAARMFDVWVGDRDRHRDQWRWGRFSISPNAPWEPIPRDRDMPFARFEGLGPWIVRGAVPQLVTFSKRYPDMVWLNWNAREIDRLLLSELEWPAWDSVTKALQAQLSDAAIDSAIAAMPTAFVRLDGRRLRDDLISRRQALPAAARGFYRVLASEVDFRSTDDADVAAITRSPDGSVHVAFLDARSLESGDTNPYKQRRFDPADTREVRVFLNAGNDRAIVRGARSNDIKIRIIGGDGDETVVDSIPGGDAALRVYDSTGTDRVVGQGNTAIDRSAYRPPGTDMVQHTLRDWGTWTFMQRAVTYSPTVGVLASVSYTHYRYGFRRNPYSSRSLIRFDASINERRPRLTYDGIFRPMNSRKYLDLQLLTSGIELIRFHGFGNETRSDSGTSYYRVFQNLFRAEPAWVIPSGKHVTWSLGGVAQFTETRDGAGTHTLVAAQRPYGIGSFGEVGARLGLSVDHTDLASAPTKGVRLTARGALYPAVWDVESTFGEGQVEASTYLSARGYFAPTLAFRAGGQHIWGTFPFHNAAFLGGSRTLRGWDEQRFAGRSAIYGSSELRVRLGKLGILVPADIGILGFADVGKVIMDGESSDEMHNGIGGGIWIAPITRTHTVSMSFARGRERTGFYLKSGFAF